MQKAPEAALPPAPPGSAGCELGDETQDGDQTSARLQAGGLDDVSAQEISHLVQHDGRGWRSAPFPGKMCLSTVNSC